MLSNVVKTWHTIGMKEGNLKYEKVIIGLHCNFYAAAFIKL
jgi:hypothetical protein